MTGGSEGDLCIAIRLDKRNIDAVHRRAGHQTNGAIKRQANLS
jgi:hypothetical protein